jgi:chromosome segregation ATPase
MQMEQAQRAQATFGKELADLREVRDELNTKLAAEQQASGEIRRRAEDLEGSLRRRTAEVEHIKADKERQAAERQRLEGEWQKQLGTAEALTKKLEAACQEITERNKRFEEEVAGLRQSRDELETKLTAEREKATESKKRIEELKRLLRQNEAELERAKAELAKADKGHETELTSLYEVRDDLSGKLASEQKATQESKERSDELEGRLRQNNADLERIKNERESHARRQAALRSELESKLSAAKAASERAEKKVKEKTAQCTRLEKEFAKVEQSRDELNGMLSSERQAVAESRRKCEEVEGRLRESTAELENLKAEREKEAVARASLESHLEAELKKAKAAAEKVEGSRVQEVEQLNRLKLEREEFENKYATEKQAAADAKRRNKELETQLRENAAELERIAAERDKQSNRAATLESRLKDQANAVKATPETKESTGKGKEKASDAKRLEQEVANLRRERQELHTKCLAEKQEGTKSKQRVKELEKQLREIAGGFTTTKLELDKRAADRSRTETNLQEQLKAATAAMDQAQAALKEQTLRADLLQRELTEVCEAREDLRAELRTEQQKTLDTVQRIDEFEARLRESAGELARAKAAAENNAAERHRLESVQGEFAENAEDLIKDLARLRENEAGQSAEIRELERRVREGVATVARVTADLEKERGERRRVEQRLVSLTQQLEDLHEDLSQHLESERASQNKITELEQVLHERERALARVLADLRKEVSDRELAEEQLAAVGDMSAQLRQYLSLFEDSKKVFKKTHEQLEAKLQASQKALGESEEKLQKEVNERQRLQEEISRIQRNLTDQAERVSLDVARLESELQVEQLERKRIEGDAQQSRYASLDSARVARNMVNTLRRQAQDAVDNLMQATRRLLEISADGEPKKLVELVLENALLIETNLHHGGPLTDPGEDTSETRAAA